MTGTNDQIEKRLWDAADELRDVLPFRVPRPGTQPQIVHILSAYGGLIANNTRRIRILEEMAQALCRVTAMRDYLLPRLVSGCVSLPNAFGEASVEQF